MNNLGYILLLYFVCFVFCGLLPSSTCVCGSGTLDSFRMVNMSTKELRIWYNDYDYCHLMAGNDVTERAKCKSDKRSMECSATFGFKTLPLVLYQHPINRVTGSALPQFRVTDMLLNMNQSKRMLVLLGDSITREFLQSLLCALQRENNYTVSVRPRLGGQASAVYLFKILQRDGVAVFVRVMFCSITSAQGQIKGGLFHGQLQKHVWDHGYSAVVMFNTGLHHHRTGDLLSALDFAFEWAQSKEFTGMAQFDNIFLYRESSMQDYPNIEFGRFDFGVRLQWLNGSKPFPTCTPHLCMPQEDAPVGKAVGIAKEVQYELEALQHAEERWRGQQLSVDGQRGKVFLVPFRNYVRHFWELHPASKHMALGPRLPFSDSQSSWEDCTHYTYAPLLHYPAWLKLRDVVYNITSSSSSKSSNAGR